MTSLQIVLSVLCGGIAVLLVALIARDVRPGRITYALLALVELGLVGQLAIGLEKVFDDHEGVSVGTYAGYLVGALVILPLAAGWSWAERTRSGTGVLLVGVVVLPVLFVRLHDIWATHA
jgi:hypothetical protein